jgi:hypothetical protein
MPLADLAEASLESLLGGEEKNLDLAALAEIARGRVEGR